MSRVGQVWEFQSADYIGLVVESSDDDGSHHVVWLVQDNEPGRGDLYPCVEGAFALLGMKRIA
jgi:hypothetical protein